MKEVDKLGLDIKFIALTHSHIDHIGAVKKVGEATGAQVAVHENEAESLHGRSPTNLFGLVYSPLPPPDRLLRGGDSIDIGELHFLVLHTPGHSP
ncbi:MAG: MBL fold metallo-hydrolase, partial [Candidatus Hermodarchaeota archaeon]